MPFYLYEIVPNMRAVIIDLKPDARANVSLYQIEDVWGFSYDEWTPLALRLKPLFVDFKNKDPNHFKKRFFMPSAKVVTENGSAIHEFLHVGHVDGVEGQWRWGRNGVVNATLLWPEVLEYFLSSLRKRMRGLEGQHLAEGRTCLQIRKESLLRLIKTFAVEQARKGNRRWHAREGDLLSAL